MGFYTNPSSGSGQAVRTNSSQTASFTAVANNNYFVSASSGAVTVTLPTSSGSQSLVIKKTDSSTNVVTLSGTINGTASASLAMPRYGQVKELYADGSGGWNVIGGDADLAAGLSASSTLPGLVQLSGDLGGTSTAPTVPALATKVNGTATITVGTTAPSSPAVGDIWIDTN